MNFKRAGILAAPTITSVIRSGNDNLVTWTVENHNVTQFTVQRKVDAGSFATFSVPGGTTYQAGDTSASADGTYTYRVRCTRGSRISDWSPEASIVVSSGPPSGSLLHEADFTYAGAFLPPLSAGGYSSYGPHGCPLALRNYSGTDKLLGSVYKPWESPSNGIKFPLYSMNIPALTMGGTTTSYNRATVHKYYGDVDSSIVPDIANGAIKYGHWWDEDSQRYYFQHGPFYTDAIEWPTVGYSTLDDITPAGTPVGIWGLSGVNHKRHKCGVLRIPDSSFVSTNCPGKPIAVGFGSGGLSIVNGHSMGPALYAIPEPDTGTYASLSMLPNQELVQYPYNTDATPSNPLRARRTADYDSVNGYFGKVTSATSNSVSCEAIATGNGIFPADDTSLIGKTVSISSGPGSGESKTISGISGVTLTISGSWTTTPTSSSVWQINAGVYNLWAPSGGVGYWGVGDVVYQSMVWIKTAGGKQAIVVFVTYATGRQFYGHIPNGPTYESGRHEIQLYDPADFAAVAQGSKVNYTVDPYEKWDVEFPWVSYPLQPNAIGLAGGGRQCVHAVTPTTAHDRIYVSYDAGDTQEFGIQFPVICAFDITP